jgi:hypothetical protein
MDTWTAIGIGSFGAFTAEVLHLYELRVHLNNQRFRRQLRSYAHWLVTLLMIVASGVGTWIVFEGAPPNMRACFITGITFPLLVKRLVAVVSEKPHSPPTASPGAPSGTHVPDADAHGLEDGLDDGPSASSVLRTYFRGR